MQPQSLLLMAGVVVCGAMAMVMIGFGRRKAVVNLDDRLAHFAERDNVQSLRDREMEQSFGERVIKPLLRGWAQRLGQMSPGSSHEKVKVKLAEAGNPGGIGPTEFIGLRWLAAIGLGVGSFFVFNVTMGMGLVALLLP